MVIHDDDDDAKTPAYPFSSEELTESFENPAATMQSRSNMCPPHFEHSFLFTGKKKHPGARNIQHPMFFGYKVELYIPIGFFFSPRRQSNTLSHRKTLLYRLFQSVAFQRYSYATCKFRFPLNDKRLLGPHCNIWQQLLIENYINYFKSYRHHRAEMVTCLKCSYYRYKTCPQFILYTLYILFIPLHTLTCMCTC